MTSKALLNNKVFNSVEINNLKSTDNNTNIDNIYFDDYPSDENTFKVIKDKLSDNIINFEVIQKSRNLKYTRNLSYSRKLLDNIVYTIGTLSLFDNNDDNNYLIAIANHKSNNNNLELFETLKLNYYAKIIDSNGIFKNKNKILIEQINNDTIEKYTFI